MTKFYKNSHAGKQMTPGSKGFETLEFSARRKKNRIKNKLARAARKKNRK